MAVVYATLIIKGYYTFEQVPDSQKDAVEGVLAAMGLGTDGKPLPGTPEA